jgi:hypothetical protein
LTGSSPFLALHQSWSIGQLLVSSPSAYFVCDCGTFLFHRSSTGRDFKGSMGGNMGRFFLLLAAAAWLASPARATDLAHVKCAVNQDRVWVYDSLGTFDVAEKLHCGAPVEILSRIKGYVKVRTESGAEGFVPDSAFPDPPSLAEESDRPPTGTAPQPLATPVRTVTQPAQSVPAEADKPIVHPAKTVPSAAAPGPVRIASAAPPVAIPVPASVPAKPVPASAATSSTNGSIPSAHSKPAATKLELTSVDTPAVSATPTVAPAPNAAVIPVKPSIEAVSASRRDSASIVPATVVSSPPVQESDDYPDTRPENESADPACRVFFAAYGLTPSQYKWLAEDRRKEFSQICPAPDVDHVDYVVLFTHDSESYADAMPMPVHVDLNGFSDFSALTPVDTALVTASEVERARYEFVWVFRVARGTFDPAKFSARRRPQFTTYVKGSRAPSRVVEDAFGYVQTQDRN